MRMVGALIASAALSFTGGGAANEAAQGRWEYVGQGSNGVLVSLDTRTVVKDAGKTDAWVRFTYIGTPPPGQPPSAGYVNLRFTFECAAMRSGILYSSTVSKAGEVIDTDATPLAMAPIVPDSIVEMIWTRVCRQ